MQLKWTDLAANDLETIEAYITKDNSSAVAMDVVISILNVTEQVLVTYPRAGRPGRVRNTRELVIDGQPYIVIYRENRERLSVEILRVLHEAQQWPVIR
ncbi:MAG: type II toxin-antitoxin system RelE/ParE family toxin [Pseudomonadota bacterium]|nr:type II toxin-antitoxin system RelE/ParE family toxin [Pseudomonadota bacterium]